MKKVIAGILVYLLSIFPIFSLPIDRGDRVNFQITSNRVFLTENNIILDFSTQGITYSVNNKKISFKFLGDREGTLLVTVNATTYSLWYYMDDVEKKL